MDSRTKNRHREHDAHGMISTDRKSLLQPGRTYWICPCGWMGWLDEVEKGGKPNEIPAGSKEPSLFKE